MLSKVSFAEIATFALLFLGLIVGVPSVRAQTTRISNVIYPSIAVYNLDTGISSPSLLVRATVNYEGARAGFYLATGIFDLETGSLVDGVGSASPISCETTSQYAGCDVPLSSSQGSEDVEFLLGRPQNVWNLAIISAFLNSTGAIVSGSESDYTFTIKVHTGLTLQVEVPVPVQVTVDGVNGTGSVRLSLTPGIHAVSVPRIVPFENGTRLRFTRWSDGSALANRTVALNYDLTLRANYVTQYQLTVTNSEVNVSGGGWYDNGTTAILSIPARDLPMSGPIGALGGKWVFVGWSENGTLSSTMITQKFNMTYPRTIKAVWQADYSLPLTFFAIVIIILCLTVTLYRSQPTRRRTKRTRRAALRNRT